MGIRGPDGGQHKQTTMSSLQTYINHEIDQILSQCTTCGVCAEVCPILPYTAAKDETPKNVVAGVLDVLRSGTGDRAAAAWIDACAGSGVCVTACPEPVNPRRMLLLARNAMNQVEATHGKE